MRETTIADAGRVRTSRLKPLPQFLINLASDSVAAEAAPTVLKTFASDSVAAEAAPTVLKTFASDSVAAEAAPTSWMGFYTVRMVPRDSILMFLPGAALMT